MIVENETTTFAGLITRPGRAQPYRFEFVRTPCGDQNLFLFRHQGEAVKRDAKGLYTEHTGAKWILMSSDQGRAERDHLWQRYGKHADPIQAGDELDEEHRAERQPSISAHRRGKSRV